VTATDGPLALLGSGEYTHAMDATDRALLAALGRPRPRVALIPAASGLEPGSPERWNRMGERHFAALGAIPAPTPFATRDDADSPAVLDALRGADLFYFSGGNPEHLVEALRGTAAWALISAAHQAGAAVAGCSAGAMMLGQHTLRVRAVAAGQPPRWIAAMGLAAPLVIMPHFDRMSGFVGPEVFRAITESAPAGTQLVGIDEDTALVRLSPRGPWRVSGRQTVALIGADGGSTVYRAGEALPL
jgi:cyanophycinase-like exopeptidase